MATAKSNTPEQSSLTQAQAAALVKREVPVLQDGKPTEKIRQVAIKADEVLSFREYEDHVVVVTVDGQKFRGEKK